MDASLLLTKLHIPPTSTRLVARPRLLARLAEGLACPLTLISAPAGFGKTTLLSEWLDSLNSEQRTVDSSRPTFHYPLSTLRVAWLSLDEDDNDPLRFLTYLIGALQTLTPDLGETTLALLRSPQPPPTKTLLTALINELTALAFRFAVVLDDYHVITAPPVHEMLSYILDHLPSQMHLVMLTRADPPLPLARLRVRNQLVELRANDLRFTSEEAAMFLSDVMGLMLSAQDINTLERRTEGWIAGLQLAALSLKGREDIPQFIATFGGGHAYIVDYLVEEVLVRQTESVRTFLLRTSILERMTGPLCDALTGRTDGQAMLEQLEHANLFVTPIGGERCWYRYHHLFADVMRNRLRQSSTGAMGEIQGQVRELHRRASRWYEQNGFADQAIQHALMAQDWKLAGSLMDKGSQSAMRNGEIGKVLGWVKALPATEVVSNLTLCINLAWARVLTGQFSAAEQVLEQVQDSVQGDAGLLVDWLAVQAFIARAKGQMRQSIELAERALAIPEAHNVESQSILALSLALTYYHSGKTTPAALVADRAAHLAEQAGNWHAWVFMTALLARIQAAQGHLHQAEETYLRTIKGHPQVREWTGSGMSQSGIAALHYEWNDLEYAKTLLEEALQHSELTGHGEMQMSCHRLMARILLAQGDVQGATRAMACAEDAVRKHNLSQMMRDRVAAEHVQLALAQGDLAAAAQWAAQVQGPYGAAFHYPHIPLEGAMLTRARGDKAGAAAMLAERYEAASQENLEYAQIEIRIEQALAAEDRAQALRLLNEALTWAQPEGYVRLFVDRGQPLVALLREAVQKGVAPEYCARLLAAFPSSGVHDIPTSVPSAWVEPLTERELQVLRLLGAGKSNQEIADDLVLAVGTVKRHLNNIFGKVGAQNRTECVARSRELRLLDS